VTTGIGSELAVINFGSVPVAGARHPCAAHAPDEIDPKRGYISIDAPLGLALLGRQLESEIEINTPTGTKEYFIVSIDYRND